MNKYPSQTDFLLASNTKTLDLKGIPLALGGSNLALIVLPTCTSLVSDFINGLHAE